MRKVSAAIIVLFAGASATSFLGAGTGVDIGVISPVLVNPGEIRIDKVVDDASESGTPPSEWEFTVTSENCGNSIENEDASGTVESRVVTTPSGGGSVTVKVEADNTFQVGGATQCTYAVAETPVAGWDTDPTSETGITVSPGGATTVTFTNTPTPTTTMPPTTVPPTTAPPTTAPPTTAPPTTAAPTTAPPTTASPTTAAPTTMAPTTSGGDISPVLPETGPNDISRNLAISALALLAVGAAAIAAARRRSVA